MLVPVLAGLALLLPSPAQSSVNPAQKAVVAKADTPQATRAQITAGDELSIVVLGFVEYSGKFVVVNDGTISVPPIGLMKVQGRTLESVQAELVVRLKRFVRDPRATIYFATKVDNVVYLVGLEGIDPKQAFHPGLDLRMLFAGTAKIADTEEIEGAVFRKGRRIGTFNMRELLSGKTDLWTGPLEPGDLVSMLPSERIRVWFLNDFEKLGETRVLKGSSLAEAVGIAGGPRLPNKLSNYAQAFEDRSRIVVRRGGEESKFRIKNDPAADKYVLEPGDTISLEFPKPATVAVQGYVKTPAPVTVLSGDDLSAAIAGAGGVIEEGTLQRVLLWRGNEVRSVDLRALTAGKSAPSIPLMDGDSVFVPKNERSFRVLGDAKAPGLFAMPDNKVIHAADALAQAGGTAAEGSLRRMVLMRAGADGVYRPQVFNLDEYIKGGKQEANPEILPGDVLFVNKPKGGPSLKDVVTALPTLLFFSNSLKL